VAPAGEARGEAKPSEGGRQGREARGEPKAGRGSSAEAMTDAEFRMLSELLRRHCGLHFGAESRYLFEKRVLRRIRDLELTSFGAYHLLLRSGSSGDQELARLVDELTINETYFFRERAQLSALVSEIVPELRAQRAAPVRIWSAGCSSGEEPYSVVVLAREAGLAPGVDLRVYASDISQRMLRRAREGVYREASFRDTEPALRERYFVPGEGGLRIADEVKQHVDFVHLNLFDASKLALLATMDAILCRNVIIYFGAPEKRRAVETFYQKLRPGGYLLLGHAESLIDLSTAFELRHLRRDLVYRRPLGPRLAPELWQAAAESAPDDAGGRGVVA
jgi:chemotaxis protein methyltransferase CheR